MVKKLCNILSTVVLIFLLGIAAAILVPMAMGYKEMAVLSGSMEPGIPVGSVVYVKPMDASQLAEGDVCTYLLADGSNYVTHRVVSIDTTRKTLITQGDANTEPDGEVAFGQVLGKAQFHLPLLGYISIHARTSRGILAICGALVVVILLNFVPMILEADEEEKKKPPRFSAKQPEKETEKKVWRKSEHS